MEKYYFFDRGIIQPQRTRNFSVHTCKGVKDKNNPLFIEGIFTDPQLPWEVRYDNGYPNVIYDSREQIFRLYYTLVIRDDDRGVIKPSNWGKRKSVKGCIKEIGLAYAESRDGVHWQKPSLGLVNFNGSKENNLLLLHAHGTGIMLDDAEPDPDKRYKMVTKVDVPGEYSYMAVSFSPDGIHWQKLIPWPKHNPKADSHNSVLRDPTDGKFKLITRLWRNGMRVSAMCESVDFINWSEPREVLRGSGYDRQAYSMPVFRWGNLFLGVASVFHEGDCDAENFDQVDLELTWATDISKFDFVAPGDALIERGKGNYPNGEFDSGVIYASPPVLVDGKVFIYYMGGNGKHTAYRDTSFGRAEFEYDKWAALTPKNLDKPAEVMTSPFCFYGDTLELLAENTQDLQVALFTHYHNHEPINGFDFTDSKIEPTDDGYSRVTFPLPLSSLKGQDICIVVRTTTASLYVIRGDFLLNCFRY